MTTLPHRIDSLSDTEAQRILTIFARNQPEYRDSPLSAALRTALLQAPDLTAATAGPGDLARAALLLLADDPQHGPILEAMVSQPPAQYFGVLETTAVLGAVLFVLGTHVHLERHPDGTWSLKIDKRPTDPSLLKLFLEKLLGFTRQHPPA